MCRWLAMGMGVALSINAASALAQEPKVPKGWRFELAVGDVEAGERAFAKMQC